VLQITTVQKEVETFQEFIDNHQAGSYLLLQTGYFDSFGSHPLGCIVRRDNLLLLNGKDKVFGGKFDDWGTNDQGDLVIEFRGRLMNNKRDIIYDGVKHGMHDWKPHNKGFVVEIENRLLLNGTELLYQGPLDEWMPHLDLVIIKLRQEYTYGTQLLCKGDFNSWLSHPLGVITINDRQFRLNGQDLICEVSWDRCASHPQGVLIEHDEQLKFYPLPSLVKP